MKFLCRLCHQPLRDTFANLGNSPLANSYLRSDQLDQKEPFFPLRAYVCSACLLVQLPEHEAPEAIFSNYAYFSSYSDTWLAHARRYAEDMTVRWKLNSNSQVIEVASNDGYLLQYFKERNIPVFGIEPAANVADIAIKKGIPTKVLFLNEETAEQLSREGISADLLTANNVLAHVPDIHSFTAGLRTLLKPSGVITVEFPHLLQLIRCNQFDTIYHEHFSYLSLQVVERLFGEHTLAVFDVEELPTHGGSLRIYAKHQSHRGLPISPNVQRLRDIEQKAGLDQLQVYRSFQQNVETVKANLCDFLRKAKKEGKNTAGYGAPAKGNTLLNYCGIGVDLLSYTVDRSPHKQGLYLPGTHIPIRAVEAIDKDKPDYVLILPWNLREEIVGQLAKIRRWGGHFVVAIPKLEIL